jgi:hypothetical protein
MGYSGTSSQHAILEARGCERLSGRGCGCESGWESRESEEAPFAQKYSGLYLLPQRVEGKIAVGIDCD